MQERSDSTTPTTGEMVEEVADLLAGLGVVLLPISLLAIPGAILLLPLALPLIPLALLVPPVLLVRSVWRALRRARGHRHGMTVPNWSSSQ